VDYATLQKKLSPFQLEKLTYLFRCLFDCNQDGVIDVSFKGSSFKNFKKKSPSESRARFYYIDVQYSFCLFVLISSTFGLLRQNKSYGKYLCDVLELFFTV
jgi:hypothetical protein